MRTVRFLTLKKLLIGQPLRNYEIAEEKMSRQKGLAILSSDGLSSVAYATEEILIAFTAFSAFANAYTVPIAAAIVALIWIVSLSYRKAIEIFRMAGGLT